MLNVWLGSAFDLGKWQQKLQIMNGCEEEKMKQLVY